MHQDTDFNAPLLQTSIDHNWTLIVYLKDNPNPNIARLIECIPEIRKPSM